MLGPWYVTTDSRRRSAWGAPCQARATSGRVTIDGRTFPLSADAVESFKAWEKVRAGHGYRLDGTDTGFYNCRHTQHNPDLPYSFHSWGMALDVNWLENPAGSKLVTDIPRPMIDDLLAIRTKSGARVFRWGGDWDWDGSSTDHSYIDAMHWEVVAHPLDLATGVIDPGDTMADHKHNPMPNQLPRDWADRDWEAWVARSGTNPETRTDDFYREDLSWVYGRIIRPLENRVKLLEDRLANLEGAQGSTTVDATARAAITKLRNHLRQS